ncbi:hypothetical protein IPN35_02290 [Candidatus Peregrinibacteria bacterium]|nr:MAG: hypothetical protein IPN35_02290 [Candidatus Peregrinibacteria bacterium]
MFGHSHDESYWRSKDYLPKNGQQLESQRHFRRVPNFPKQMVVDVEVPPIEGLPTTKEGLKIFFAELGL